MEAGPRALSEEPGNVPDPGSPHDLLRVSITIAAIAVALSALREDSPVAPFFLAVGLLASAGTAFAMMALWEKAGLGLNHQLTGLLPAGRDYRFAALIVVAWAFIALFVAYAVFFFTTVF